MNFLRGLSTVLFVVPLGMFLYDLVKGWFVDAHVQLRTLQQWWMWFSPGTMDKGHMYLSRALTVKQLDTLMHLPGFAVMIAPPLLLYILYRIWFAMAGGKSAGGFKYKSRD